MIIIRTGNAVYIPPSKAELTKCFDKRAEYSNSKRKPNINLKHSRLTLINRLLITRNEDTQKKLCKTVHLEVIRSRKLLILPAWSSLKSPEAGCSNVEGPDGKNNSPPARRINISGMDLRLRPRHTFKGNSLTGSQSTWARIEVQKRCQQLKPTETLGGGGERVTWFIAVRKSCRKHVDDCESFTLKDETQSWIKLCS